MQSRRALFGRDESEFWLLRYGVTVAVTLLVTVAAHPLGGGRVLGWRKHEGLGIASERAVDPGHVEQLLHHGERVRLGNGDEAIFLGAVMALLADHHVTMRVEVDSDGRLVTDDNKV